MAAILTLTNNATLIDLLASPYQLAEWTPQVSQWKDGGVFSTSPFSDIKVPIYREYETTVEKFTVHILGSTQNAVISATRALLDVLEDGFKSLLTDSGEPTYITAKGDSETNSRYASVLSYRIEELPQQYSGEFYTGGAYSGTKYNIYSSVVFVVERTAWLSNPPITQSQATITQNGVSSNSLALPVMNFNLGSLTLTHIYTYDASTTTFSSNRIASTSFTLLPSSTATGDILYIGHSTATFCSVWFNIGVGYTGTGIWEYYSGSWVTLSVSDKTNGLQNTGNVDVTFSRPSNWSTTSINGVTAYWIRFRATSSGTTPTQTTRVVYTPYSGNLAIENATSEMIGDIKSLVRLDITSLASGFGKTGKLYIGRRAISRGSDFSAYINPTNNPGVISFNGGSSVSNLTVPTNSIYRIAASGSSATTYLQLTFSIAFSTFYSYIGSYRIFIRANQTTGSAGNVQVYYNQGEYSSPEYTSQLRTVFTSTGIVETLDLGVINIPRATEFSKLNIAFYNTNASSINVDITDIILMPIDENCIYVTGNASGTSYTYANIRISNLEFPRMGSTASAYTDNIFTTVALSDMSLDGDYGLYIEPNTNTDFWIFRTDSGSSDGFAVRLYYNNRYLLPRGTS